MQAAQSQRTVTTDTLARRLRFSRPNPKVRRLVLTDADYLIFEAIDRHGPLPTGYLYEFTKHLRQDFSHLQNRLTEFYNGDVTGGKTGGWLTRPPQQFANFEARYQHLVYGLTPRARMALAERGTCSRFALRGGGPFVHQLMAACVGASLELKATEAGIRYISREEILAHPNCVAAKDAPMPLAIPVGGAGTLIPDDLFGLHYPGHGYRFFAVEVDRCTESIERSRNAKGTFSAKIAAYQEVLSAQRYREWWGIPNLTVLTVTTSQGHAANLVEYVRRSGQYGDRFAFTVEPLFGANWRVPKQVLAHLLDQPWMTAHGTKDIGRA